MIRQSGPRTGSDQVAPQHRLYFRPLLHGHGSLRPGLRAQSYVASVPWLKPICSDNAPDGLKRITVRQMLSEFEGDTADFDALNVCVG